MSLNSRKSTGPAILRTVMAAAVLALLASVLAHNAGAQEGPTIAADATVFDEARQTWDERHADVYGPFEGQLHNQVAFRAKFKYLSSDPEAIASSILAGSNEDTDSLFEIGVALSAAEWAERVRPPIGLTTRCC